MLPLEFLDDFFTYSIRRDLSQWIKQRFDEVVLQQKLKQDLELLLLPSTMTLQKSNRFARLAALLLYEDDNKVTITSTVSMMVTEANLSAFIELLGELYNESYMDFHRLTERHWCILALFRSLLREFRVRLTKPLKYLLQMMEHHGIMKTLIKGWLNILLSRVLTLEEGYLIVDLVNMISEIFPSFWKRIDEIDSHFGSKMIEQLQGGSEGGMLSQCREEGFINTMVFLRLWLSRLRDHEPTWMSNLEMVIMKLLHCYSFSVHDHRGIQNISAVFEKTKWHVISVAITRFLATMDHQVVVSTTNSDLIMKEKKDIIERLFRECFKMVEGITADTVVDYLESLLSLFCSYCFIIVDDRCLSLSSQSGVHHDTIILMTFDELRTLWSLVRENIHLGNGGHHFLENLLGRWVNLAFHDEMLLLSISDQELRSILHEIFDEIMTWAQARLKVLHFVARRFLEFADHGHGSALIKGWATKCLQMLLFGPLRKDHQYDLLIDNYIACHNDTDDVKLEDGIQFELSKDSSVRAMIICILNSLDDKESLYVIFSQLLEFLALSDSKKKNYFESNGSNNSNSRNSCYNNTMEHRIKLRAYQATMVLLPSIMALIKYDEHRSHHITYRLFELLSNETLLSLRYYAEWCIMYLLCYNSNISGLTEDHDFWARLRDYNQRPGVVCSLLTILAHLLPYISVSEKQQSWFTKTALDHILPWLVSGHHSIRIYAAACFKKLETIMNRNVCSLEVLAPQLDSIRRFLKENIDAQKLLTKLEKDGLLDHFDPITYLTLHNIFTTLPAIGHVAEDEWISGSVFLLIEQQIRKGIGLKQQIPFGDDSFYSKKKPIVSSRILSSDDDSLLLFSDDSLHQQERGLVLKTPVDSSTTIHSAVVAHYEDDDYHPINTNYPCKLIPWEQLMIQADLFVSRSTQKQRRRHEVIVVATLIDKLPNLAGLTRTCEIFNAQKLMISNLRILEEITFTQISVTAEHWIPIEELREKDLIDALQNWKREHYDLIGVEQTVQSVPLDRFEFPEKCVLVLGREKEGIPVKLLPYLDTCVEIPQFGIIR
jgi:tRNA(Leu) C34 or U34 (ribose-2'-O)-methylase TrmL